MRAQPNLNVWLTVQPLLVLFARTNGSLDLPLATLNEFWEAFDRLMRFGAWLHHSPDGMKAPEAPSPLAGVRSPTQVRAEHVTPTFVGRAGDFHDSRPATACVVGVMPMGFQQILALLQGASNDRRVVVNYAQNFSFLIYRPSAAPDIVTNCKKQRSSKAISCVNVEGDEAAFGASSSSSRSASSWRCSRSTCASSSPRSRPPIPENRLTVFIARARKSERGERKHGSFNKTLR